MKYIPFDVEQLGKDQLKEVDGGSDKKLSGRNKLRKTERPQGLHSPKFA
jgi:hypothetical protein